MAIVSSTKSLIEVVNDILLLSGERPVNSLSSPVARKAALCLQDAVLEIATMDDWSFLRADITALSWNVETANLGDVQRILRVSVFNGTTKRSIPFVEPAQFDARQVASYSSNAMPVTPCWTLGGYGEVRINPYPITNQGQSNITFSVIRVLMPPQNEDEKFALPDRYMPIVIKRGLSLFTLRHLDDSALAAQFNNEYEQILQNMRNRERNRPHDSINAYKGRR